MRTPSPFQQAIYDAIVNPQGNLIINAVAGSGKTTTLVGAAERVPSTARCVFLAFNKSIATELGQRLPQHFQARTFHSLCYSPVTRALGVKQVNADKLRDIIREKLDEDVAKMYGPFIRRLVGLARNAGIVCLIPDELEVWEALVEQHDLSVDSENASIEEGINFAREVLKLSNQRDECDFDDLLYFAVLKQIALPKFDWVFVDEAQDTNAIQRELLRKIMKPSTRLVAVGDPAQAIYGFRGADSNSMNLIAEEFRCAELPLSVTYRCATSIVEYAQDFVPEIQAREGAPAGSVNALETEWRLQQLHADDLVVCRTTAPLIDLGWKLMRARIPLRILGRDIGDGLIALVKKCDKRGGNVDAMVERLEAWRDREMKKAQAKGQESKAEAIEDKANAILLLAADLPERNRSVAEIVRIIGSLFEGDGNRVTLSTVHKAKGLEANVVWWLGRSLCPSRWARQEWQQQQERNIMYVAITRAKAVLNMIETDMTLKQGKRREQEVA
jgi:DNA helicase-2/ATP-dependent DNA helicase PcrA